MKTSFVRAVFTASLLCTTAGLGSHAIAAEHLSRSIQQTVALAQKALQSGDAQGAMDKLKEAQATSGLSDYDIYIINRLVAAAALNLKDFATADTAEEAAADSPAMPDEDKKSILHDALEISAQAKHWQKTVGYGQQLAALNALDLPAVSDMAVAYYNLNDAAHAAQYAQQAIDLAKSQGKPADPGLLQIVMNAQVKSNNQAGAQQTLEQIYQNSGDLEAIGQLIDVSLSAPGMNDVYFLDMLRLKFLVGAMQPDDYVQLANAAYLLGYPEEAVNVLQQGSGKAPAGKVAETLRKSRNDAATDQRQLPSIAAEAARAKAGQEDVKLAEDYWGYNRFADAEAAARRAIGKGGIKTAFEGELILGMSLVAQGKYDDAIQTLSRVGGSQAAQKTAHLWTVVAQYKKGSAAPASAPAH
jgi:hypothetical protein